MRYVLKAGYFLCGFSISGYQNKYKKQYDFEKSKNCWRRTARRHKWCGLEDRMLGLVLEDRMLGLVLEDRMLGLVVDRCDMHH